MSTYKLAILTLSVFCGFSNLAYAFDLTEDGKWKLKTMLRLRFESDWNSIENNSAWGDWPNLTPIRDSLNGSFNLGANRYRIRLAVSPELQYFPSKEISFGVRLGLSNSDRSNNSNLTLIDFQNNKKGTNIVYLDKWFAKFDDEHKWLWVGRNTIPFWVQNDYFWDAVTTPAGVALGGKTTYQQHTLGFSLGYFATPQGKYKFNGHFASLQGTDIIKTEDFKTTLALGLFIFNGHDGNFDKQALTSTYAGYGARDYKFLMANLQTVYSLWDKPLTFGADGFWNFQYYPLPQTCQTATACHQSDNVFVDRTYTDMYRKQVLGGVLSIKYGSNVHSNDWSLSYSYAYIGGLAANADFAQSDAYRGSTPYGRLFKALGNDPAIKDYDTQGNDFVNAGTGIRVHEFRAGYTVNEHFTLTARTFLTSSIGHQGFNLETAGFNQKFKSNRFRLDFTFNF